MTNIEQFTRELMLAHDIDYWEANKRAEQFYDMLENDRPEVLNGWISVDDRLPEEHEYVLIRMDGITFQGYLYFDIRDTYANMIWVNSKNNDHFDSEVTHWQPLPEPPKEK